MAEPGDADPEVVELGVAVSEVVEFGVAVFEVWSSLMVRPMW
ncbi:hypothetical protein [Marinobacter alexandrii]